MIHFCFIKAQHLHWRARKKLAIVDKLLSEINEYSSRNIKLYVDTDTVIVVDPTCNKIIDCCEVTFNMDKCIIMLQQIRDYFYYLYYPNIILHNEWLRNRFIYLKDKFYGKKEKSS